MPGATRATTGTAAGLAGASGSGAGFADTGTYNLDARTIDAYGSGPHPAAREAADPPGLVHTGQQERYDGQYGAYSGYEDHGDYQDAPGYGPPQGFDQGFEQGGYGQGYDSRDDYADPYQDRYGDDGTAPPAGKPGKTRKNPGNAKRGKRRLLIAVTAVVVAGILAAAGYVFVLKPKPSTVTPTSAAPLPSPGSSSAATAACVKQFGQYCHIELRTDDPAPLTLAELFPPAFVNETDHGSFTRAGTKLDTTCSNAVIGQDLIGALQDGKCTQVLRASYFSGDGKMMGTIGVANLSTTNEAHHAGKLVGTSDFVDPLTTTTGVTSKLGKGTGIVEAEYKGHYLIMIWAEFASTNAPANNTQDQQLQQFGADLIAGTANISLSQRMLNGHPATRRQLAAGVLGDAHLPGERGARRELTRRRVAHFLQAEPVRRHDPDRGVADRGGEDGGRPRRRTAALTDREERADKRADHVVAEGVRDHAGDRDAVVVPPPVEAAQRAHRGRALPAPAEGSEVVLPGQRARRGVHRGEVESARVP